MHDVIGTNGWLSTLIVSMCTLLRVIKYEAVITKFIAPVGRNYLDHPFNVLMNMHCIYAVCIMLPHQWLFTASIFVRLATSSKNMHRQIKIPSFTSFFKGKY